MDEAIKRWSKGETREYEAKNVVVGRDEDGFGACVNKRRGCFGVTCYIYFVICLLSATTRKAQKKYDDVSRQMEKRKRSKWYALSGPGLL